MRDLVYFKRPVLFCWFSTPLKRFLVRIELWLREISFHIQYYYFSTQCRKYLWKTVKFYSSLISSMLKKNHLIYSLDLRKPTCWEAFFKMDKRLFIFVFVFLLYKRNKILLKVHQEILEFKVKWNLWYIVTQIYAMLCYNIYYIC